MVLKELEKGKAKNPHVQIYHRLKQLFPDLPTRYIDSDIYKAKQYPKDKTVVFGGKRLFEKLCKNHLTGKAREKLKKQRRELKTRNTYKHWVKGRQRKQTNEI